MIKLKVTLQWEDGKLTAKEYSGWGFTMVGMQIFNELRSFDFSKLKSINIIKL